MDTTRATRRAGLRVTSALAAVTALTSCSAMETTARFAASRQGAVAQLVADVSGDGALTHLRALQRIADDNDGTRASPGPGYEASVDYVVAALRRAGFEVSTPTFTVSAGQGSGSNVELRNVVAQTATGSPDHVVMLGAHLDSVPAGPGINDNGSGVGSLLEIAEKLGSSPQLTNAVRFSFWGSEEVDLDGSTRYVEALNDAERQQIMMYVNLDMVASPNAGYFVQGGKGRKSASAGPPGSARIAEVLVEQFAAAGVAAETATFDGESDYAAFLDAGIPSGGVLAGDENKASERQAEKWGGRAGEAFDSCYHRACDRVENINGTALDRFTDAVAGTAGHFAASTTALTN